VILPGAGSAHSGNAGTDSSSTSGGTQQDNAGNKAAGNSPVDPKTVLFQSPVPVHPPVTSAVAAGPDASSLHRGLHAWETAQNDEAPHTVSLASPNELHLSVHTAELGRVDLHATLKGDAVGATISVQKSDAGAAIAAGLPHLEHILHEQQIPVSHLSLNQGGAGAFQSNSQSHGQQTGQQPRRTPWTGMTERTQERLTEDSAPGLANASHIVAGRLSVRA
jgi:flagellar hook-length control protein FliK